MPGIPRGAPGLARNPTRQAKNVEATEQQGKRNGFGTSRHRFCSLTASHAAQPRASVVSSLRWETAFLAHLTRAPESVLTYYP